MGAQVTWRSHPFKHQTLFFYNGQGNEGDEGHGCHEGHEGNEEEGSEQDCKGRFAKVVVFRGSKAKTSGGLTSSDLIKNSRGKIVSKKASQRAKKNYYIKGWITAVQKARKALGLKGFVAIKKGSALYKKAKELYQ